MPDLSWAVWIFLAGFPLTLAALSDGEMSPARRRVLLVVLGAVGLAGYLAAPHFLGFSDKELLVFLTINVLVVTSYRVLALTGEFSLAHVVLMGVGAYGSALYTKQLGVPVPVSMVLGAATSAAVACVLAFPLFRMKGFYFLIGSFAAGEVIRLCWKRFRDPFGGPKGIKSVPGFPDIEIGDWSIVFWEPVAYYYLVLAVVAASIFVMWRIERSRIGLTFHAVHWQDQLASAVGVNTWRTRTLAFVIASFFAGLAGALLVHYLTTTNPNQFDVDEMVYVLIFVIVGGTATIWGPIVGLVVLTVINDVILRELGMEALRPLFFGVILILAMLFLPDGLETLPRRVKAMFGGRRRAAEPAE